MHPPLALPFLAGGMRRRRPERSLSAADREDGAFRPGARERAPNAFSPSGALENVWQKEDIDRLHALISRHAELTNSTRAERILTKWTDMVGKFVKVMPIDYRRVLERMQAQEQRSTDTTPATEEVFHG